MNSIYQIKISGPAGFGIKSSGLILSETLIEHGLAVTDYTEYPSLVRGGLNTYQVSFSQEKIFAVYRHIDHYFVLTPGQILDNRDDITPDTVVFFDDDQTLKTKGKLVNLPLRQLSSTLGSLNYRNTISLGVIAYLYQLSTEKITKILSKRYSLTIDENIKAFNIGYEYAHNNFSNYQVKIDFPKTKTPHILADGNECFGWGFLNSGGNFYSAYPMTPATGALHFLATKQTEYKINVLHPEDEISAASLAVGASFAGARAATGTSGGGFALMTETVSFAGVANLPIVFYLVSRPGPATGLPTWTAQGDLLFAVNAGHGEFPKIVLAPGTQEESYQFGVESMNLAAKFNVPVILVSDKYTGESASSVPKYSGKNEKIITSTKALPGEAGGEYLANSYEHDEHGYSTEDSAQVQKNVQNRQKLIKKILPSLPKANVFGYNHKNLVICWGSVTATLLETLKLRNDFTLLQIRSLWPINPDLQLLFKPFKNIIVVENNATSQLTTLLKSQFDFNPQHILLKYDGRPFYPEEISNHFNSLLIK